MGAVASGQAPPRAGTISADGDCTSVRRRHPRSVGVRTYYARWHTFSVDSPGWVTITLESSASNSRHLDPFLVLLRGHETDGSGAHIAHNDDHRSGYDTHRLNSRLVDVFLQPGDYTIEAITYSQNRTGNYTLTVEATFTGLQASYDATVGRELRIDFDLGNHEATATASHADFGVTAQRAGTTGTLLVVPDSTNARTVTLSFARAGASGGAAQQSANGAQDAAGQSTQLSFVSSCGTDQTEDLETGACIWDEAELLKRRDARYSVGPALLRGAIRVARRTMSEYSGECDMTPTRLAALMLAIGIYETNPIGSRSVARSLMFLSRVDRPTKAYPNDQRSNTGVRAFWHPGVGYWQLDWWPNELNHAERADVDRGGNAVAKHLRRSYCDGDLKTLKNNLLSGAWNGCIPDAQKNANGNWIKDSSGLIIGTHKCFNTHNDIYLGGDLGDSAYQGIESLWINTSGNEGLTDNKGGVQELKCRWGTAGAEFGCWLYDTDNPEGFISRAFLTGVWTGDHKRSPLAAPFISFTDEDDDGNKKRFAVFPESFAGGSVTWFKHVPVGSGANYRVRKAPGNTWNQDTYDIDADGDRDELRVKDCTQQPGTGPTPECPWVDVAASDFKTAIRRRYPDQPGD
ncbi:DVUA0089 family protein [Candidatus Poriferisodalis sp.]|uniref:DVUA0089 family protein n=1 Tax=Candidatus Poriferisodalis sp. TaxID=3101277 RepID=UPI003AF8F14D